MQFHALPSEISNLFDAFRKAEGVRTFSIDRNGKCKKADSGDDESATCFVYTRLGLPEGQVKLSDISSLCADAFVIEIGKHEAGVLGESWAWSMARDPGVLKYWRRLLRSAKRNLLSGLVAVGRDGRRTYYRDSYVSVGATAEAKLGMTLKPIAGNARFEIPTSEDREAHRSKR